MVDYTDFYKTIGGLLAFLTVFAAPAVMAKRVYDEKMARGDPYAFFAALGVLLFMMTFGVFLNDVATKSINTITGIPLSEYQKELIQEAIVPLKSVKTGGGFAPPTTASWSSLSGKWGHSSWGSLSEKWSNLSWSQLSMGMDWNSSLPDMTTAAEDSQAYIENNYYGYITY
jgi:hypothetical protein